MGAWEDRPLDPGWTMLPDGRGRQRPDGSIEWAEGQGPSGYDDATENQAAQTRNELGQIDSQQANRWDKFGTGNRPPTPDEVAPRGTRAWRDAFDKEQNWLTAMAEHGASPGDLGLQAKVGQGLANFSRWGEITQNAKDWAHSGNWVDPNTYGSNPNLAFHRAGPNTLPSEAGPTDQWPGNKNQVYTPSTPGKDPWGGWSETHGQGVQLPTTNHVTPGTFANGVGITSQSQNPMYPNAQPAQPQNFSQPQNTMNNYTPGKPVPVTSTFNRNPAPPTMGRRMIGRGGFGGGLS